MWQSEHARPLPARPTRARSWKFALPLQTVPPAGVQALEAGVVSRLQKMIDRGEISHVTRNNLRSAITLETGKGK